MRSHNIPYTKQDIKRGYQLIRKCIDIKLREYNVIFITSNKAPNTYKAMRSEFDKTGIFKVYNGGDHGLLGKTYNIRFRALHDAMHYKHNLSFSFQDEKKLSLLTALEFAATCYNELDATHFEMVMVRDIINAEIKGQIEYYQENKKYVDNQSKFILDYLEVV